ncbi:MAG: OmpA family protein [Acidobacteriota bacterium]
MQSVCRFGLFAIVGLSLILPVRVLQGAEALTLHALRFSERRDVKVKLLPTRSVGDATMEGKVRIQEGQSWIEIKYEKMKPAVLFAGDVTCYVMWAVNRDGTAQNLGELWVRPGDEDGSAEFSTGFRNFALLVTAEAYYQVDTPSELVVFWNDQVADPPVASDSIFFNSFAAAPAHGVDSVADIRYDGKKPLDLIQAERVIDIARRLEAPKYAPQLFSQAQLELVQATNSYERKVRGGAQRFARSSVASSNEAIRLTQRRIQMEQLEQQIAQRQQETQALEERANQAEAQLKSISEERQAALANLNETTRQLESLRAEREQLEQAMNSLQKTTATLREQQEQLRQDKAQLEQDKAQLQNRLQSALSQVAETRESARGLIVNLPDILFDVGKATLKPEANMALAKLAGILLVMPDLNLRIEGHTDSTGSADFNKKLSLDRARSVFDLMASLGVASSRMETAGYGMEHPVADNSTAAGRQKNRRVEIVVAEGHIAEE